MAVFLRQYVLLQGVCNSDSPGNLFASLFNVCFPMACVLYSCTPAHSVWLQLSVDVQALGSMEASLAAAAPSLALSQHQ